MPRYALTAQLDIQTQTKKRGKEVKKNQQNNENSNSNRNENKNKTKNEINGKLAYSLLAHWIEYMNTYYAMPENNIAHADLPEQSVSTTYYAKTLCIHPHR